MMFDDHAVQTFIATNISVAQVLLFTVTLCFLWGVEAYVSSEPAGAKWAHTSTNAFLIMTALPLQLVFNLVLGVLTNFEHSHHWGVANYYLNFPNPWAEYILMFFVFDLLDYIYHRAMHNVRGLWRFHLVHHTDGQLDVSSTLREHPGETLLRNCFLTLGVLACGASFEALILRQTVQTFTNILSHTSLRLPPRAAQILGWIFITPNLHHVHHHFEMPYTNSNYGDTLSIWDRLFGTYAEPTSNNSIAGLDTHMNGRMDGVSLILLPYIK